MQLFDRAIALQVGTSKFTGLRMSFRVVRSMSKEPNTCEIKIFNLSADSRAKCQTRGAILVLQAGYIGSLEVLFSGEVRFSESQRDGTDWVTSVKSGDGEIAMRTARVNDSLGAGASIGAIVKKPIEALEKAGIKGASAKEKFAAIITGIKETVNGIVMSGNAYVQIQNIAASTGKQMFVDHGQIIVLGEGETFGNTFEILSPSTGLIGSPDICDDGASKSGTKKNKASLSAIKANALLRPGCRPGRKVKIESEAINGFFRVEKSVDVGDNFGQDWTSQMELSPL